MFLQIQKSLEIHVAGREKRHLCEAWCSCGAWPFGRPGLAQWLLSHLL